MIELKPNKELYTSSWDYYYTNKDQTSFQRFRQSETPELTKKVKTQDGNNWKRIEIDLPLDPKRITVDIITDYLALDNYKFNFKIHKTCFVFWMNNMNFVYYITYNDDMKETGRFIEVEINKNVVKELQDPVAYLNEAANKLSKLGISPQNRMKKSLFEIFVKPIDK